MPDSQLQDLDATVSTGASASRPVARVARVTILAGVAVIGAVALSAAVVSAGSGASRAHPLPLPPSMRAAVVTADTADGIELGTDSSNVADSGSLDEIEGIHGLSGKLLVRLVVPARPIEIPALARLFGDSILGIPGVHTVSAGVDRPFSVITLVPFEEKVRGRLGSYRMGFWPDERGTATSAAYDNPAGFIRVTRDNQDTRLSEHFRIRDFLTKDQATVWPKYLVMREELIDKLELIVSELQDSGTPVHHVTVMSGFRTPQYNSQGVGAGGRAQNSRHQYGDAADIFVDNDRDGRLDDLNGDGRVNMQDVRVMLDAVERVERRNPSLVGGAGMYKATSAHGPFVHVDVRGSHARWGIT